MWLTPLNMKTKVENKGIVTDLPWKYSHFISDHSDFSTENNWVKIVLLVYQDGIIILNL